jgi:hypothetical protein
MSAEGLWMIPAKVSGTLRGTEGGVPAAHIELDPWTDHIKGWVKILFVERLTLPFPEKLGQAALEMLTPARPDLVMSINFNQCVRLCWLIVKRWVPPEDTSEMIRSAVLEPLVFVLAIANTIACKAQNHQEIRRDALIGLDLGSYRDSGLALAFGLGVDDIDGGKPLIWCVEWAPATIPRAELPLRFLGNRDFFI